METRLKSLKSYFVSRVNFYLKLKKSLNTENLENLDKSGKIRKPDEIPEKKTVLSNLRSKPLIV